MLIGILQTGQWPPTPFKDDLGDYPDMFRPSFWPTGMACTFRTWRVVDRRVSRLGWHDCDGWLITGSRHGTYEDHPWIRQAAGDSSSATDFADEKRAAWSASALATRSSPRPWAARSNAMPAAGPLGRPDYDFDAVRR